MKKFSKPVILVLSSPSGGGKTTLKNFLMKKFPSLSYSVSTTTRPKRKFEKDGVDYNFVSDKTFENGIKKGAFIEWAKVHGFYYGTPVKNIRKAQREKKDILLDLDVVGAKNLKKIFPGATLVFIAPPSLKVLKERIEKRGTDDKKTIALRLKNARKEMKEIPNFDYLLVNDKLEKAIEELIAIYISSRLKIRHSEG